MVELLEETICWLLSLVPPFWVERHHRFLHANTTIPNSQAESLQMFSVEPLFDIGPIWAVLSCALLTVWFVGSLYLWPESRTLHRDSPLQIKRRFASVGLVCLTATIYLYLWARSVLVQLLDNNFLIKFHSHEISLLFLLGWEFAWKV